MTRQRRRPARASSSLLTTDPYPDGDPSIMLYGCYAGPADDGEAAMAPIRALGAPLFDAFGPTSYFDLQSALGEEIRYGLQSKWRGGYFRDGGFDDDAFATIVDCVQAGAVRLLDGPLRPARRRRGRPGAGGRDGVRAPGRAVQHLSAISLWEHDDETAAERGLGRRLKAALAPHLSGGVYPNYADEDLHGLGGRLLRGQLRPPPGGQAAVRPGRLLPPPAERPAALTAVPRRVGGSR